MKTIVIDARIINSTTGRYVERLLRHLENIDQQHVYKILVPKKDLDYYRPRNPNFEVLEADFDNYSFAEQTGFNALLKKLDADLVHFCMPQQPILYPGEHVTTVHDLTLLNSVAGDKNWFVYKLKQAVGRFVFKRIGQTSSFIISPSHYTSDEYQKFSGVGREKLVVTHLGADPPSAKPEAYTPLDGKDYLLYVGNQSDYKNIRRLMRAHQQLLKDYPDLQLVLVGKLSGKNGTTLRINQQWARSQEFENILFTDFVSDEQLAWLYQHAAAYVFPSLMEGFGLPGLEAMLNGAPVVSSNATCLPEVYGDAAHYFDPTSVEDMAAKIREVLNDQALRKSLIQKGSEQVKKYSWETTARQTLDVYRRALGEK